MDGARVEALIRGWRDKRVLVVGDVMLDRYLYGAVDRISPEAPVPVVRVTGEDAVAGGAANVALNLRGLGAAVEVAGLVGADDAGRTLLDRMRAEGIGTECCCVLDTVQTTVKTRVLAERQQVVRVDREERAVEVESQSSVLLDRLATEVGEVDAVIIEDYGKGVVSSNVVKTVLGAAAAAGCPVAYDPKDDHPIAVSGLTLATPNFKEACTAAGLDAQMPLESARDARILDAAEVLASRWGTELLLITLGAHGMLVYPAQGAPDVIPTVAREVFDVSGAGDTVIAASLLSLLSGATSREAAVLANHAAGVVCGKVGTAPCSADELRQAFCA